MNSLPCLLDCDCHSDPELDHESCDYCTGKSEMERAAARPEEGLDAAWAQVEAALPKGSIWSVTCHSYGPDHLQADYGYEVRVHGSRGVLFFEHDRYLAAALRALAARLSEQEEGTPIDG